MAKATLTWHLFVDCPKCKELIDLADQDDDHCFSEPLFSNRWEDIEGEKAFCPKCKAEFVIDQVEY